MMPSFVMILSHTKRLRRIFPLTTAFLLAAHWKSKYLVKVYLKPLKHKIYLRPKTTDLSCFEQVFSNQDYLSPYVFNPKVIIDAGANVGAATLFFAQQYPDAKIIALEPDPSNFKVLRLNCAQYSNVEILEVALWSKNTRLSIADSVAAKHSVTVEESCHSGPYVKAITVKEIMQMYGLERIDLLKMDIEGAEKEVFEHCEEWLSKVDLISVETHDRFKRGCSFAFYSAISKHPFRQEIRGEITAVDLRPTTTIQF